MNAPAEHRSYGYAVRPQLRRWRSPAGHQLVIFEPPRFVGRRRPGEEPPPPEKKEEQ